MMAGMVRTSNNDLGDDGVLSAAGAGTGRVRRACRRRLIGHCRVFRSAGQREAYHLDLGGGNDGGMVLVCRPIRSPMVVTIRPKPIIPPIPRQLMLKLCAAL